MLHAVCQCPTGGFLDGFRRDVERGNVGSARCQERRQPAAAAGAFERLLLSQCIPQADQLQEVRTIPIEVYVFSDLDIRLLTVVEGSLRAMNFLDRSRHVQLTGRQICWETAGGKAFAAVAGP